MGIQAVSQWWMRTKDWLKRPHSLPTLAPLRSLLVDFVVIVALIVLAVSVALEVLNPSPIADPISVPKSLADIGYTSEVVAARLITCARIIEQEDNATSDKESAAAATSSDLVDAVAVEGTGLSVAVIVASVRRFLGLPARHIGGDIVIDQTDKGPIYRMTVRVSGPTPLQYADEGRKTIEAAIKNGARAVTGLLRPCALAAYLLEEPDGQYWLGRCFADPENRDVEWAHNLRGLRFYREGNYDAAIKEYRDALGLRPNYQNAQRNLSRALSAKQLMGKGPPPRPFSGDPKC
jgi:tetratricopeptide (TPR) repeat protein